MMTLKLLGVAAIVSAMIVTPVMAQQALQQPGAYEQNRTFGAAGVVGGAIGTPGAIASAPFRGSDSYAYYDGGRASENSDIYYRDRPVSRRTTCGLQPDATYLGPDGRWYPC